MIMKKEISLIFILVFIAIILFSCNKRIIPGLNPGKQNKSYDEAAFNYIYVEAVKQKIMGNGGEALKYFEQCLSVNPLSDASYYQMAQIVLSNGDLKGGKKYVTRAIDLRPENIWYLIMLAGIYYQEKNLDSAIYCYEKAVKYFPDREDLQLSLGNLYTENKKYDKARSIFDKFDEKYGVNESTTISLIRNLMAEKKYKEALSKVQQLLKQSPDEIINNGLLAEIYRGEGENGKALEVYNQLIKRNPDNPQIQLSLCEFLLVEKNFDELLLLTNTLVLNNKISREDKVSLFASFLENVDLVKNHASELELALMVLEANYENDDVIALLRPELLQKENKLTEAGSRLEEIIKQKPENYYAWEKLLLIYYDMHDFQKLLERGEECATKFNMSFLAKILYANGAIENKKFSIALEELQKANILAGENKEMQLQVLTMRADVYYRMKDYSKSFEAFEEALKTNSEDLTVLNNYAYYLAEQNMKLKEAEVMAKKVIEKEKNNTTFLDTYAWVLYKRGKNREASKIMERIINSGVKDDAEWYEHFGYILKKQRKCREAAEKWEIALKLDKSKEYLIKEIENCKR